MGTQWPTLAEWDKLSLEECKKVAREVGRAAPGACQFNQVKPVEFAGGKRLVAFFRFWDLPYAFVPGGKVTLGYDRKKPFKPSAEQKKSWDRNCRQQGVKYSLKDCLDENLSPLREVEIKPFLMGVYSQRLGLLPAPPRDTSLPGISTEEMSAKRAGYEGFRIEPVSHDLARSTANTQDPGLRLPTSDEWEYACGSGSRSLFRWGNDCPTDCFPDAVDESTAFKLHAQPNALGLCMPVSPFSLEWVAEPDITRGGDGGGNICGDADWFVGWLPMATAWVHKNEETQLLSGGNLRRAYSL